ncbi:restriction endonuclease subunit S [Rubritalea tangerina]|uniref:Restriction endonuclease subunit S n=1 Tax=Rubritalea tangerina TaxID=430798 RepID=A0ABW4ZER6_9BACT
MAQNFDDLPELWEWKEIAEVFDVRDGTHDSPKYQDEGYPLITSKNLGVEGLHFKKVKFISEVDYEAINKRSKVDKGDMLFAMIGTIGNPTIIDIEPSFAIKNVALFKPKSDLATMQHLKYVLQSPRVLSKMLGEAKGATQKFVGLTYLRKFRIPLPPKAEQERIVAKLDALFSRIDKAIAHLKHTHSQSKALSKASSNLCFDQLDSTKAELGTIVDFKNGYAFKSKDFCDSGVPVLRISNIQKGGIDYGRMTYVPDNTINDKTEQFYVEPNEIVIAMSGATTGKIAMNDTGKRLLQNQRVGRFIIKCETLRNFVFLFLETKVEENLQQALGAAQPNLSTKQIKELQIPLPPLAEQQKIVAKLDALSAKCRALETATSQQLERLESLKASLLDTAFKGKL